MIKHILLILAGVLTFATGMQAENLPSERKKVGLVLSGGGAKGMAHIGALKVIEKAGIPIDYVVGTNSITVISGRTPNRIGHIAHPMPSLTYSQCPRSS